MNVEFEARAFRIWQFCQSQEWGCTAIEIAEGTGIPVRSVCGIIGAKKWGGRIRGVPQWDGSALMVADFQRGNYGAAKHVIRDLIGERRELAE